tara:strand:+ start:81 stop:599 length:519 start_codon:yes stop_codon:yes gene_type:complete
MGKMNTKTNELDYSTFSYQGLRTHKSKVEAVISKNQEELELIDKFLQVSRTLEIAKNLEVIRRQSGSERSSSITVATSSGHNMCRVYSNNASFANQITLIPEMLKIVQKVASGAYSYTFREEAEKLLEEASGSNVMWDLISKERHKTKARGYTRVSKLVPGKQEPETKQMPF